MSYGLVWPHQTMRHDVIRLYSGQSEVNFESNLSDVNLAQCGFPKDDLAICR
jgi:hypothetical protein